MQNNEIQTHAKLHCNSWRRSRNWRLFLIQGQNWKTSPKKKKTCQNIRGKKKKRSSCSVLAAVVAVTTQHHSVSAEGKLTIKKKKKEIRTCCSCDGKPAGSSVTAGLIKIQFCWESRSDLWPVTSSAPMTSQPPSALCCFRLNDTRSSSLVVSWCVWLLQSGAALSLIS